MSSSTSDFLEAGRFVATMRRPLLLSHTKPDGDAFGSLVALRELLRGVGSRPLAVAFDPLPHTYDVFRRFEPVSVWRRDLDEKGLADADGVVILDTCAYNQLLPLESWLKAATVPIMAVDHHVTRDVPVAHLVLDETAAATCLILYQWARRCGWKISRDAATAMLIGLATDTGWFTHSNTDPTALRVAAELVELGVSANELYQQLYQCDSTGRVRLRGAMLSGMKLLGDGRLAVMRVDRETLHRTGATLAETENLINDPLTIRTVVVSLVLSEQKEGPVRVSFRSKAPIAGFCELDVDVAAVARCFGGGGHRRASGARIEGTLDSVEQGLVEHILPLLG